MSRLAPRIHTAVLSALLVAWLPATWTIVSGIPRPWSPYVVDLGRDRDENYLARSTPTTDGEATNFQKLDAHLESWARPGDLVLVHSIPSGVIGVTRYLRRDIPLASWVAPLGIRRVPADLGSGGTVAHGSSPPASA